MRIQPSCPATRTLRGGLGFSLSGHEDFSHGPGPFHEFFRSDAELMTCGVPGGGACNGGGPEGGTGGAGEAPVRGGGAALRRLRVQQTWGGQVDNSKLDDYQLARLCAACPRLESLAVAGAGRRPVPALVAFHPYETQLVCYRGSGCALHA